MTRNDQNGPQNVATLNLHIQWHMHSYFLQRIIIEGYFFVQALAHQYSQELLEVELEKTRLNIVCFMEASLQPSFVSGSTKTSYSSFQAPVASPSYRKQQPVGSPGFSRRRRWELVSSHLVVYLHFLFPIFFVCVNSLVDFTLFSSFWALVIGTRKMMVLESVLFCHYTVKFRFFILLRVKPQFICNGTNFVHVSLVYM